MPSGHFSLEQLKDAPSGLRTAKTLRMKLVACPHITADRRPNDAAGTAGARLMHPSYFFAPSLARANASWIAWFSGFCAASFWKSGNALSNSLRSRYVCASE